MIFCHGHAPAIITALRYPCINRRAPEPSSLGLAKKRRRLAGTKTTAPRSGLGDKPGVLALNLMGEA